MQILRWCALSVLIVLPSSAGAQAAHDTVDVLIAYHSDTGNTERMAQAVAEGAQRVPRVRVTIRRVTEVAAEELQGAHAIILGSPTHWANLAAPVKQFIDSWPDVVDRIGGAFATGGATSGGREHVITSIVLGMLSHGMVVVGPVYREGDFRYGAAGVSAVTGSTDPGVSDGELAEARVLGQRVAEVAARRTGP